jgi:hypothetical protein
MSAIKEFNEAYLQSFSGVRVDRNGPDAKDISQAKGSLWAAGARTAELAKAAFAEQRLVAVGNRGYSSVGAVQHLAAPGAGVQHNGAGSSVAYGGSASQPGCPTPFGGWDDQVARANLSPLECANTSPCAAHLLGANSLGQAGFPLSNVIGNGSVLAGAFNVTPRATPNYKPQYMFFEARNALAAGFPAIPGLLVDARIRDMPQLSASGNANGIVSSAFSVDTPLDVRTWNLFGSDVNNQLNLTVGNMVGTTDAHFFFIFWGDNVGSLTGA